MAPEAVMLLIDSSEYLRNGDFPPTRFDAQKDAVSVLFNAKINANPENTVGVMTMGGFNGKGPEVLATPTADLGKILSAMHRASIGGESDLYTGIQIAQLALKHRQNKTQRQRLIILVGSPLAPTQDAKQLVKLGKKLKKNNVAVDVVTFASEESEASGVEEGEEGGNEGVLRRFVEAVNSGDNSHFLAVEPGPRLLSDVVLSSDIMGGEGPAGYGGAGGMDVEGGGGGGSFEFGVDPDMDPELAMVLRMSMEEEQARQAAAAAASSSSSAAPALDTVPEGSSSAPAPAAAASAPASTPAPPTDAASDGEDAELAAALRLSAAGAAPAAASSGGDVEMDAPEGEDEDEEEAIRKAIELSMQEEQKDQGK